MVTCLQACVVKNKVPVPVVEHKHVNLTITICRLLHCGTCHTCNIMISQIASLQKADTTCHLRPVKDSPDHLRTLLRSCMVHSLKHKATKRSRHVIEDSIISNDCNCGRRADHLGTHVLKAKRHSTFFLVVVTTGFKTKDMLCS